VLGCGPFYPTIPLAGRTTTHRTAKYAITTIDRAQKQPGPAVGAAGPVLFRCDYQRGLGTALSARSTPPPRQQPRTERGKVYRPLSPGRTAWATAAVGM